jgi:uncharacterized membrane protein YhaH (DUF805 family)
VNYFKEFYIDVIREKYTLFEGRSSRKEYWFFTLFNCIIYSILFFIATAIEMTVLWYIYLLFMLIPSISIGVRRMHDTGRSGFWFFINFIPFGSIIYFVFTILDSQPGTNKYGSNPKEIV